MQCREFEDRLNLLLDERQPPEADAQLSAHAAGCEPCGQLLAGQRVLLTGLRKWQAPRVAPSFAQNVVARSHCAGVESAAVEAVVLDAPTHEAVSPRRRTAWFIAAGLLAAAAAALMAVSIAAWNSSGGSGTRGTPEIAKTPKATPSKSAPPLAAHSNHNSNNRRGPRAGSIAGGDKIARGEKRPFQPSALSLLRPQGGYGVAIAEAASNLPDAVERLDEVERYAPGIRPIRVSFTMILQAFWRAIPGNGTSHSADDPAAMQLYGSRVVV